ncbi:tryptophan 7-halogenase [Terriglobus saanensis]|uniref:Lycopene beta and epsilon cyclase n=1 Tax=Terriglobus saanensis (strain ATCC BAA-1853 / DSM 23119 / SP1PR4) TaxID=401053 RepID=E8V092_TERSS|nr:tryptophan 7-halogenase [Terriglobus saanensis]ADV83310.1 Lycopene beta and epsilon cyclase [Terriglobus saanensis SP1PR4]
MLHPIYDVAVLGGGPAGCACALSLRQCWPHLTVAVVEASQYDTPRAGEILAPQAMPLLHRLRVDATKDAQTLVAQSIALSWGDPTLSEHHHLFSAHGFGLHLDRRAFDRHLAQAAEKQGATLLQGTTFRAAHRDTGTWTMDLRGAENLRSRFVVDATGRNAVFARSQRVRSDLFDRLTAYSLTTQMRVEVAQTMIVEACALGWWYTAPLPSGHRIISLLTDVDLARAAGLPARAVWEQHLAQTRHLAMLHTETLTKTLQVVPAFTTVLHCAGSTGWVAAGDAVASYDPLAGQGITKALHTGILASYVAAESLMGREPEAKARYEAMLRANLAGYRHMHRTHYAREKRWADQPFWQRRHSPPARLREVAA